MWWQTALAVLGGLVLLWGVMVLVLYLVGRKEQDSTRLAGTRSAWFQTWCVWSVALRQTPCFQRACEFGWLCWPDTS